MGNSMAAHIMTPQEFQQAEFRADIVDYADGPLFLVMSAYCVKCWPERAGAVVLYQGNSLCAFHMTQAAQPRDLSQ